MERKYETPFGEVVTSTVTVAPAKDQEYIGLISTELSPSDKVFIEGSVRQGLSNRESYSALTAHKVSRKEGRILKPLVDKYHADMKMLKGGHKCPLSGLVATKIAIMEIKSGDLSVVTLKVPMSPVLQDLIEKHGAALTLSFKEIEGSDPGDMKAENVPYLLSGSGWGKESA